MVASPVLVDSSFYIALIRLGRDPLRVLEAAAVSRDLAICGVVRCEVGRRLRDPKARERFASFWNVMMNVPTDKRLWEEAESVLWELDRQGTLLSLSDVLIACSARRIGAAVLTLDRHFSQIPGVEVIDHLEEP